MKFELGKIFLAFIVLINPLQVLPLFLELTRNFTRRERRRTAQVASASVLLLIVLFTLGGGALLKGLGISIGAFQVGGGILVFVIALSMVQGKDNSTKPDYGTDEAHDIVLKPAVRADIASVAVVPLAVPLMGGPGAISTIVIHASAVRHWQDTAAILGAGCLIAAICYLGLLAAERISRLLGDSGLTILNRIMGMLLAAVAVEIITAGLRNLFPQLLS